MNDDLNEHAGSLPGAQNPRIQTCRPVRRAFRQALASLAVLAQLACNQPPPLIEIGTSRAASSLPAAAVDITLTATFTQELANVPMISATEFQRLLGTNVYSSSQTAVRRMAVGIAASVNAPEALGVHGSYEERGSIEAGIVLVARDPAWTQSGTVQATDFDVATLTVAAEVDWVARNTVILFNGRPNPSCTSPSRGCAPLPRSEGRPQIFSNTRDDGAGLPDDVPVNAETGKRPVNASGKTLKLRAWPDPRRSPEPNEFICAEPSLVSQCTGLKLESGTSTAARDFVALPVEAVLISEEDFVHQLDTLSSVTIDTDWKAIGGKLTATANHTYATGIEATSQTNAPVNSPLLVVARNIKLNSGGLLTATQFYFVPARIGGVFGTSGYGVKIRLSRPMGAVDFSAAPSGPITIPDLTMPCGLGMCGTGAGPWRDWQGNYGGDRLGNGLDRTTMRYPFRAGSRWDIAVIASTLFEPPLPFLPQPCNGTMPEQCNGRDDNCNGAIDEATACEVAASCPCQPRSCGTVTCATMADGCGGSVSCGGTCT